MVLTAAFVSHANAQSVNLTIRLAPANGGSVGVSPIAKLCNTGSECTFPIASGTAIRLTANTPAGVSPGVFSGGTGSAAGCATSTCDFTITANSEVTVTFGGPGVDIKAVRIDLAGDGAGNVGVDNNRCQSFDPVQFSACTVWYASGSVVTLYANQPPAGTRFSGFSAGTANAIGCSTAPCAFTLTGHSSVTATFHTLTSVSVSPASATIGVGQSHSYTAVGTFSNGVTEPVLGNMGTWVTRAALPTARFSLAATTAGGLVYALGGVDGVGGAGTPRNLVHAYDPLSNMWTSKAPMLTAREGLAVGAIGGFIYAAGGNVPGSTPTAVLEAYDVSADTWSSKAPMAGPRRFVAGAVANGVFYVVGGEATSGSSTVLLATVEAYDPTTNTWTTKAPMPTARRSLGVAVLNGLLYAIGGKDSAGNIISTVEVYNPATDTWATKAPLPLPREAFAAAVLDNDLYVIGGNRSGFVDEVDVYDTARNTWFVKFAMPTRRSDLSAASVGGRIYAIGGHVSTTGSSTAPIATVEAFTNHLTWSAASIAVADVNDIGQVTGTGVGTTAIVARAGTIVCPAAQCGAVTVAPWMTLDRSSLAFGAVNFSGTLARITPSQEVTVTFNGGKQAWTATTTAPWLVIGGGSGRTGNGKFTVTVVSAPSLPASGTVTATIQVTATGALNSPKTVDITLYVQAAAAITGPPFGALDTPANGAVVQGAVPVTGWALDDIGVDRVEIWRNCLESIDRPRGACTSPLGVGLPPNYVFLGRAFLLPGARPDVEALHPGHPLAYRSGWGFMLLTNALPHQTLGTPEGGQGAYVISAFAIDVEQEVSRTGPPVLLGARTITVNNDGATQPFGAIDTPSQGGTIPGTSPPFADPNIYPMFGWAVTQAGKCIDTTSTSAYRVFIDGVPRTLTPGTNWFPGLNRSDIAAAYPGLCNTNDALAAYYFNAAALGLESGLHTVSWDVTDSGGQTVFGLGTRFFNLVTSGDSAVDSPASLRSQADIPSDGFAAPSVASGLSRSVTARVGSGDALVQTVTPDASGSRFVQLPVGHRLILDLGGPMETGHQQVGEMRRALPAGSTLDRAAGTFAWEPPIGYFGPFELVFTQGGERVDVTVTIVDGTAEPAAIAMHVDTPTDGAVVSRTLTVGGWALDGQAASGSGIDAVHVWAVRRDVPGFAPQFVGAATLGVSRPDVAQTFGAQFSAAGFQLTTSALARGTYEVTVYVRRQSSGQWEAARTALVTIR